VTELGYEPVTPDEGYDLAQKKLDRLAGVLTLPGIDEGSCEDCGRDLARARVRYGQVDLCRECARKRLRLASRTSEAA
jgi:hypothetical protein